MAWVNNEAVDLTGVDEVVDDATPTLGGQLDAANNKIVNLAAPTSNNDAARKTDVDAKLSDLIEDLTPQLGGNLDANAKRITNLAAPTSANDAVRKTDVDDAAINVAFSDEDQEDGNSFITLTVTDRFGAALAGTFLRVWLSEDWLNPADYLPDVATGAEIVGVITNAGADRGIEISGSGSEFIVNSNTAAAGTYQIFVAVGGRVFAHEFTTTGGGGGA